MPSNPVFPARYYSAPPEGTKSVAANYIWDPTAVVAGASNGVTGNWVPMTSAGTGAVSVVPQGATYAPTISLIAGTGQVIIPATAKAWSVAVISGAAWVDGAGPLFAGTSLAGGNYDIRTTLSRSLAVGATGTIGAPSSNPSVLVTYEV